MKTERLIAMLAAGAAAVDPDAVRRRYALALGWGAFGATLLMAVLLGVRPDLAEAARLPMFWFKAAFPAALAAAALAASLRLARPGARRGWVPAALAAPVLVTWLLAAAVLLGAESGAREGLVFGATWNYCLVNVPILSLPVFGAAFWAIKDLAPTRPALAGAASGLLAGSVGALAYSLHCPEMAAPFLGVWYLLGMLIPAAAGALLGPWLLRW